MGKSVVIVGGGVIGLVLAKELAKSEIDVTLYEAKKEIGEDANRASGILSVDGLSNIDVDYKSAVLNKLDGAILYAGKEKLNIKAKKTMAYVLDRRLFAKLCAKEAEDAGARIVLGKKLDREALRQFDKNMVIVGADGAVSNVASAWDFPKINEYILTYKAEYENADITDLHSAELFFSTNSSHRFFAWTVPYSQKTMEVGLGESMHSKRDSYSAFKSFVNSQYMKERLDGAEMISGHASIIPLEPRKKTVKGNVLLVGDAAGQVKATTGGGIIFGTMCAKTAAQVITNHIEKGTPLLTYEKLWRRKYGLDLRMHRIIHNYYSSLSKRSFELVFRLSKTFRIDDFLSRYGDMDKPSVIVKRLIFR
jgi:digeranylgeranylglycerophospholipid reductase